MSSHKITPAGAWIGFGRNYFHNLGVERWHEMLDDCHKDEVYSWGLQEEQELQHENGPEIVASSLIEAYHFGKEIPDKKKGNKEDHCQLAPAACSSSATFFLSGSRHNRIMMLGTVHGHVMSPTLEEKQTEASDNNHDRSLFTMVSPSTVTIPLPLRCVELAAGRHFCLARLEGGLAVCSWGAGHFGQLGHGTTSFSSSNDVSNSPNDSSSTYQATPKVIERLLPRMVGSPIVQIAAGDWHAMALSQEGTVLAWGCNRNNQCGRKSIRSSKNPNATTAAPLQMIPMPVTILETDLEKADDPPVQITKIACGKAHSLGISRQHKVYCWGATHYGQCASNPGSSTRTTKYTRNTTALPRLVESLQECHVIDVAAGDRHTLALTHGGRVFSWGAGGEGQLGIFPPVVCTPKPRLIQDLDFVGIAASDMQRQALALASTDPTKHATAKAQFEAEVAHTLALIPTITSVHAAGCSSYAVSSSGHVYAWGSNDARNLGLPVPPPHILPYWEIGMTQVPNQQRLLQVRTFDSQHNVLLPRRIESLANMAVQQVISGPSHCWFLSDTRPPPDENASNNNGDAVVVGRTLYEVERMRKHPDGRVVNGTVRNDGLQIEGSSSWGDSAGTSDWGGSSLTPSNTLGRPQLISQTSTMPTDDEDNTAGIDLMSASMPALPSDDDTARAGPNNERRMRPGRRYSDTEVAPNNKSRHFSLSNLLRKLGVSNRKNSAGSATGTADERSLDRTSNHSKNKRMSGDSAHSTSGKGRFRLRSNNG